MGKLYGAAPVDEIELARIATKYVSSLCGEFPSEAYLQDITRVHGSDLATMVFYQSLIHDEINQSFIQRIDNCATDKADSIKSIKLFIIPAFFYKEYPEVGGGGKHVVDVARACGLEAEIIPIKSTGSVTENCETIHQTLKQCEASEIWVMSMSKGSAEFRMLLQANHNQSYLERVKVWFNVSGLASGCHLIDHMMSTTARRLKTRTLCVATGASYRGLEELLTSHPSWQQEIVLPENMQIVNIFGVPLLSHIQRALITRYNRLKQLGPNDGMVLLSKAYIPGWPIYPLWGSDHFLRDSRVIPLLYKLFTNFSGQSDT